MTVLRCPLIGWREDPGGTLYPAVVAYSVLCKTAGEPVSAPVLSGTLYASASGWVLLSVPNAIVRGLFAAMDETGIELPPGHGGGPFNAHVSVLRADEVESIGGVAKLEQERGKVFHYQLGRLMKVDPVGWPEMSKVWFVEVKSPELQDLRKSYGLPPLPGGRYGFHITVAVKKKNVLKPNSITKL